eukprot:jgi/Undpi1/2712/HiC_scaffold_14.g06090.m1
MAARDSRDKKGVERFVPPEEQQEKGKHAVFEGSGTKLGDIPIVPINLNKIDADHDLLKAFHSILYGAVGKKTVRKKNIRSFSGFDDNEDPAVRAARVKKLGVSKKWTVAALRDLCTLLGLEKGGDKSDVVDRIVSFLASPDPSASKGPVVKKPKAVKKRKSAGGKEKKAKKVKREVKPRPVSGYIMFCKGARPKLSKEEGPMKPQEVMAKMAKLWSECSAAQKEKYKQAGVKEFEKKQAGLAAASGEADAGGDAEDDEE